MQMFAVCACFSRQVRQLAISTLPTRRFYVYLILLSLLLAFSACDPANLPADTEAATSHLVQQGILRPLPMGPTDPGALFKFAIGLAPLSETNIVKSKKLCEGAAGSVIPPLAMQGCGLAIINYLNIPSEALRHAYMKLHGITTDPYEHQASLSGIERFWVHQSTSNDCWAAALETARSFLHLHHESQDQLLASAHTYCPKLQDQPEGADTYQILFTISRLLVTYDHTLVNPHFCNDVECIAVSLTNHRPVIMLGAGHAVLIVGIDYQSDPSQTGGKFLILPKSFQILDPLSQVATVETKSMSDVCKADALISY